MIMATAEATEAGMDDAAKAKTEMTVRAKLRASAYEAELRVSSGPERKDAKAKPLLTRELATVMPPQTKNAVVMSIELGSMLGTRQERKDAHLEIC